MIRTVLMNGYLRMNIESSFLPVTSFEFQVLSQCVGEMILVKRSRMSNGVAAIVFPLSGQSPFPELLKLTCCATHQM